MEKWLILGLGQGIHKTSLKHLVVLESKERLKNKEANKKIHTKWESKEHRSKISHTGII